eukprot:gene2305-17930_t
MLALLKRCQQKNIKLNKDKFKFKSDKVSFIGHTLTQNGLKIDPAKVEAITKMSKPKDVAGVQRFIGMVKYLAKFLPRLSEVCEPLRNLTHKDAPWVWEKDHDKSFADIQKAICEAPVLKYFDHKAATEGQADASSKGLDLPPTPLPADHYTHNLVSRMHQAHEQSRIKKIFKIPPCYLGT